MELELAAELRAELPFVLFPTEDDPTEVDPMAEELAVEVKVLVPSMLSTCELAALAALDS